MKLQSYPAVEPLWPYGTVAHFYVKDRAEGRRIGIRELVVSHVEPLSDGWRVVARLQDSALDVQNRQFVFQVDNTGESPDCVPWDDDLEEEYNPRRADFTEAPGTVPIRVGGPTLPPNADVWAMFDNTTDPDEGTEAKAGTHKGGGHGGD